MPTVITNKSLSAQYNTLGSVGIRRGVELVEFKVILRTIFTDHMTQPTVSSTEGQQLVSPPGKGPSTLQGKAK